MGSSSAQGAVRRDLRLKLLFPGRARSCAGMDPLCPAAGLCQGPPRGRTLNGVFGQGQSVSAFPQLPPRPSVSSFPRPGRSSAPAYSSVMKRPLSRCRRQTLTLCVPSGSPGAAAERWGTRSGTPAGSFIAEEGQQRGPGLSSRGSSSALRTGPAASLHLPGSGVLRGEGEQCSTPGTPG